MIIPALICRAYLRIICNVATTLPCVINLNTIYEYPVHLGELSTQNAIELPLEKWSISRVNEL